MKTCKKGLHQYEPVKGSNRGCPECTKEWHRNNHKNQYNVGKRRETNLRLSYGIDLAQYNQLLIGQNNRCAICKRHQSEFKRALDVDHDHKTGRVRGLLCNDCNVSIGKLQDSVHILQAAIEYLNVRSDHKGINEPSGLAPRTLI